MDQQTLAFAGVAAILVVTPGPDMALVAKNGIAYGRRSALATAFGINAGIVFWTLTSAIGLAAVVRSSAIAFETLRFAGAAYLVFLGIQAFRAHAPLATRAAAPAGRSAFRQGVVSNLLNPKLALVFTSLVRLGRAPGDRAPLTPQAAGAVAVNCGSRPNIRSITFVPSASLIRARNSSVAVASGPPAIVIG